MVVFHVSTFILLLQVGGGFKTIAFESQCITASNYEKVFRDNIERFTKRKKPKTPVIKGFTAFANKKVTS